ncbi:MAG: 4Fe-4S dicluster domain-containing protein [Anaerolineae bacterium]|nr:4Fe-4S dicluster domain-containing protein [Anaerolineae bacterium]
MFPELPPQCQNLSNACRWTYWNVEGTQGIMYALMAFAVLVFVGRLWMRVQAWRQGQGDLPFDHLGERISRVLKYVVAQYKILRDRIPGTMHLAIFTGFTIFFIGTALATIDADITLPLFNIKLLSGAFYLFYKVVLDVFSLIFMIGLSMALWRRLRPRPSKLTYNAGFTFILGQLWLFVLTGLLIEAMRIAYVVATDGTRFWWAPYSVVGYPLGQLILALSPAQDWASPAGAAFLSGLLVAHRVMWWFHVLQVFVFIATMLDTPLRHIIYSPLNIFFSSLKPAGQLSKLNLEDESIEQFGVAKLTDFKVTQLLNGDACTECGRCQAACPAYMAGTALNPKRVILDIRDSISAYQGLLPIGPHVDSASKNGANGSADGMQVTGVRISEDALWACTTCRACVHECPVLIEHVDAIVDMRRDLVMMESNPPRLLQNTFTNAERAANPWGNRGSRLDWANDLDFEIPIMADKQQCDVLYWVGCAGAFDPNSQRTTRAVAKILNEAGVDWGVLGDEEMCHCEWARRAGNEPLYQGSVEAIIEVFNQYKFNRIITHCPHCFNTIRNEFPEFGGKYEVIHHSMYIAKLINEGKIKPYVQRNETITYHDSCYLGRYNGVYDGPREMLDSVPGVNLVEMARSKDRGLCCGGGGAQVWMETHQEHPVNQIRLDEAMGTAAQTVATACPFCTVMLDSAAQSKGVTEQVKIRDVAEIVAEALQPAQPALVKEA